MNGLRNERRRALTACAGLLFFGGIFLIAQRTSVRKDGGVIVIRNPVQPVPNKGPSKLVLEEELTIGLREKESGFHFEDIGAVRCDAAGNIFVLDRRACQVKKFNETGEFLKSFGRSGQGPGEFGPPNGMHIIADKEILVSSLGRLSYFDLEGTFIRQTTAMFWGAPVPDSQGNLVAETNMPVGGPPKFVKELRVFDSSIKPLSLIDRYEYVMPSDTDILNPFPRVTFYAVQPDDSIVWGAADQYLIVVSAKSGTVLRRIYKEYVPIKITQADKKSILSERAPGARYEFPENYPPFRGFHVDDEGRLFVRTYQSDKSGRRFYDVFDKEGTFYARAILKGAPLAWRKGKLYGVAEDPDGFLQVKRFRARWE